MKKSIIILCIFCICLNASGQSKKIFAQKVEIISNVITNLIFTENESDPQKIILTGYIDSRNRTAHYTEGFSYNGIAIDDSKTDPLLLDTISKIYPNGLFYENNDHHFFRGDIVKSTAYVARDSCVSTCKKIYFEIKEPMEGWQNVGISSYFDRQYADSAAIYKYYGKKLSIPVFVCSIIGEDTKINNYIFVYDILSDKNKIKFVKKIDLTSN